MGTSISYSELDRLSRCFGAYLQSVLKLHRGARVALMMPNLLQYPVAMFGALRSGYTVVNCNPLYSPRELAYQLKDSGAEAIVIVENFANVLSQAIGTTQVKHVITTQIGDLLRFPERQLVNVVVKYVKRMVPAWNIPGAVSFRSALAPAPTCHGRRSKSAPTISPSCNIPAVRRAFPKARCSPIAISSPICSRATPGLRAPGGGCETIITALPLYHIFALTANCLVFFKIGATNVLVTNPRDIPGFVKELGKHPFTAITGVNTLFNALLNNPDFAKLDFSSLRLSVAGGMALRKSVAERWKQVTGKTLIEAYGLTETSPAVAINPLDLAEYNGSIGLPVPSTEIAIRDEARQRPRPGRGRRAVRARPAGDEGLLAARGRDRQGYDSRWLPAHR